MGTPSSVGTCFDRCDLIRFHNQDHHTAQAHCCGKKSVHQLPLHVHYVVLLGEKGNEASPSMRKGGENLCVCVCACVAVCFCVCCVGVLYVCSVDGVFWRVVCFFVSVGSSSWLVAGLFCESACLWTSAYFGVSG